jgi:hypothetical protein
VNALALVFNENFRKLGCLELWWLRVFIALNHQVAVGEVCWRWAHRTVQCATGHVLFTVRCACHVTQPLGSGAQSTVGGFILMRHRTVRCHTGQVLFTVRCASDSAALTLRTLLLCQRLLQSTVARVSRCFAGTPDSPVNYSGVRLLKPESGWFNPVRAWCTGHYPVAHRTVRCARPEHTWFLLLL